MIRAAPHACQVENWLLEPGDYWTKVRRADWQELQGFVEAPTTLWVILVPAPMTQPSLMRT